MLNIITEAAQLFSDNVGRRDTVLKIIEQVGCCSVSTISAITGLEKNQVWKVIKSLANHGQIKIRTVLKTEYWGVAND